jgi:5'(3')-deoxyribonucleotidase
VKGYRRHLAIDLDDVVLDLTGGVARTVAREHDVPLPVFDNWNMDLVLKPILGMPWMKWMRKKDWLWATFPAIDGAIGGLEVLRQRGYYLECVTSKPEWAEPQVWKWLGLWRPAFHRVTIMSDGVRKVDVTDADLLIDDKPENCLGFLDEGRRAVLFTRPHNKGVRLGDHTIHVAPAIRADSWSGILEAVERTFPEVRYP